MNNDAQLIDIRLFTTNADAKIQLDFSPNKHYEVSLGARRDAFAVASALRAIADMIMHNHEANNRQSGRTTQQLRDAPTDSVYVVCNQNAKDYTRRIAQSLGRGDIHIVTPAVLDDEGWVRSLKRPAIVVDHATRLVGRQYDAVSYIQSHMRG